MQFLFFLALILALPSILQAQHRPTTTRFVLMGKKTVTLAYPPVAFDVKTDTSVVNLASFGVTDSIGPRANFLLVAYQDNGAIADSITSMTWNGVSMTRKAKQSMYYAGNRIEMWYLVNPATGRHRVQITTTSAVWAGFVASSWENVDIAGPLLDWNFVTKNGVSATSFVTAYPGECIVDVGGGFHSSTYTPGVSQTQILNQTPSLWSGFASYRYHPATSMTWSVSPATDWVYAAVRLVPQSATKFYAAPNWPPAGRDTGVVPVAFIGNSVTASTESAFISAVQLKYGNGGLGLDNFAGTLGYGGYPATCNGLQRTSTWVVYALQSTDQTRWGISGFSLRGWTGDTLLYSPAPQFSYDVARIWYLNRSGSGNFKYHVDGGVGTLVTVGSTTSLGSVKISGLNPATAHTIKIDSLATDSVTIYGIETYNSTRWGIVPYWLATGGSTAHQWGGNYPNLPLTPFLREFYGTVKPAVTTVWEGFNDAGGRTSVANYASDMTVLVDTLEAIDTSRVVLITHHGKGNGSGKEDETFNGFITQYRDSLTAIAGEHSFSYWDERKYFGEWASAFEAGYYSDNGNVHLSALGIEFVVQGILKWLNFPDTMRTVRTGVKVTKVLIPTSFSLDQNYPNPFNPTTTIQYGLPHRSWVKLTIFNTLGQIVDTPLNVEQDAGYHEVKFNGSGFASGMYFYRIQAGSFLQTKKLLMLR